MEKERAMEERNAMNGMGGSFGMLSSLSSDGLGKNVQNEINKG